MNNIVVVSCCNGAHLPSVVTIVLHRHLHLLLQCSALGLLLQLSDGGFRCQDKNAGQMEKLRLPALLAHPVMNQLLLLLF